MAGHRPSRRGAYAIEHLPLGLVFRTHVQNSEEATGEALPAAGTLAAATPAGACPCGVWCELDPVRPASESGFPPPERKRLTFGREMRRPIMEEYPLTNDLAGHRRGGTSW
jgi:hypothetical protein